MLKISILVLLCLSRVYSETVEKDSTKKETDAEKSKRHATHQEPCPPEHISSQIWKPEIKQAINIVKPLPTGWQSKSSGWEQQKWQPPSTGWQPKSSGWDQQKWQPMPSGWQQLKWQSMLSRKVQPLSSGWEKPKWQPTSSGWDQQKWQAPSTGWQPKSSGWEQQKWQPATTGWQPKSSGWDQQKWQPPTTGWQPKSSGWEQQKWQPPSTGWQPKSSGWDQPKWQPATTGWQPKSSGWDQQKWQPKSSGWDQQKWQPATSGWQQPKINVHKPMFEYAPMYHQPMVHKSWSSNVQSPCPDPCKSSHGAVQHAPLPPMHHIKIPQINYIKPQIHPVVHLPPVQNKVWEEPCD